jgi:two-component system cell cycle sensor histidine kinase/response regulator CckA
MTAGRNEMKWHGNATKGLAKKCPPARAPEEHHTYTQFIPELHLKLYHPAPQTGPIPAIKDDYEPRDSRDPREPYESTHDAWLCSKNRNRELEHLLQEAQQLASLGAVARGISHDFNKLLSIILGNLELAQLEMPPGTQATQHVERAIETVHHATDLIRQIMIFVRNDQRAIKHINLSALIQEIAQFLDTARSGSITTHFDLMENLAAIEADAIQLRRLVLNLVTNAADAIGSTNGTITLRTYQLSATCNQLDSLAGGANRTPGEYVVLEITDTGSGMDAETVQWIFEPYFTTKATGNGLGLATVREIVSFYQGAIDVSSILGQGTTFRILFPVVV